MVAVRAATSGSARKLAAQTGANTAITALSELVLANLSAEIRLMKPKPYESNSIPTTTPPAPVHREGFTISQLILIGRSSGFEEKSLIRARTERSLSKIAHLSVDHSQTGQLPIAVMAKEKEMALPAIAVRAYPYRTLWKRLVWHIMLAK